MTPVLVLVPGFIDTHLPYRKLAGPRPLEFDACVAPHGVTNRDL